MSSIPEIRSWIALGWAARHPLHWAGLDGIWLGRRCESGNRKQETGNRRQKWAGARWQEAGGKRREAGGRRQEAVSWEGLDLVTPETKRGRGWAGTFAEGREVSLAERGRGG